MAARVGLSREIVTRAAARIADREGLDALTLARLAARLKIKPPSLFNHVDGMPALKRELRLLALRELGAALGRAAIGKSGDAAVRALAAAYRAFVKRHPGIYALTVSAESGGDSQLRAASEEVVQVCLAAMSAYGLPERDAIHAIRALRSLVHGFATLEVAGGFGIPIGVDESFDRAVQIFLRGLVAKRK